MKQGWQNWLWSILIGFPFYVLRRFVNDRAARTAAALSFATLLALVPLFAVTFAIFSLVPAYQGLFEGILDAVFDSFLPEIGEQVEDQISIFVENASTISGVSFLVLLVTIHVLISNVIDAFNLIWCVREPRPFWVRFTAKWLIIILGPLLVGASILLSSYTFAQVEWMGLKNYSEALHLPKFLPFFVAFVGFTVLYMLLPARSVALGDAAIGGAAAGFLFEFLKSGFGIYLRHFPSYEAIYGALAAIPVVLVWTYLVWVVVLLGAEICAAMPEWRAGLRGGSGRGDLADRLAAALTLMSRLDTNSRGDGLSETTLRQGLPVGPGQISDVLARLQKAKLIRRRGGRWSLARKIDRVQLEEVTGALGFKFDSSDKWPPEIHTVVRQWLLGSEALNRTKLRELFPTKDG